MDHFSIQRIVFSYRGENADFWSLTHWVNLILAGCHGNLPVKIHKKVSYRWQTAWCIVQYAMAWQWLTPKTRTSIYVLPPVMCCETICLSTIPVWDQKIGLGLAGLVLCLHHGLVTLIVIMIYNDLEGHNFSSTIYIFNCIRCSLNNSHIKNKYNKQIILASVGHVYPTNGY